MSIFSKDIVQIDYDLVRLKKSKAGKNLHTLNLGVITHLEILK